MESYTVCRLRFHDLQRCHTLSTDLHNSRGTTPSEQRKLEVQQQPLDIASLGFTGQLASLIAQTYSANEQSNAFSKPPMIFQAITRYLCRRCTASLSSQSCLRTQSRQQALRMFRWRSSPICLESLNHQPIYRSSPQWCLKAACH